MIYINDDMGYKMKAASISRSRFIAYYHIRTSYMTSAESNNIKPTGRAQLKHVLLDVNFLSNPKIRALRKIHKAPGVLALIDIYSAMSRATNATICYDAITAIIEDSGIEKPEIFVDYCLKRGLIQAEGKGYSNSQVIKDQEQYFRKLNPGNKKDFSGKKFPEKSQEKAFPDTDYDYDIDIDPKKNSHQPEIQKIQSKFFEVAERSLLPTDDPNLQKSNHFINLGRRPMRNYPEIHLSGPELIDVLEQYEQAGIPIDDRKIFLQAFKSVAGKIKTKAAKGESTDNISAYNWLIGFAKTDLLKEYGATLDVKRKETYLERAKA